MTRLFDLNSDDADLPVSLPVEQRVKRGMAVLDKKFGPEWVARIDVNSLQLAVSCDCVLGQLYRTNEHDEEGYYRGAADVLGVEEEGHRTDVEREHGFIRTEDDFSYSLLTAEWKSQILARRLEMFRP